MSPRPSHRGWTFAFVVDAALSLAAGLFWMLAPSDFVRSTFGVRVPDAAHVLLALKGGLPLFLLAGVFYLLLLTSTTIEDRVFRRWQQVLLAQDVAYVALGLHMYGVSTSADPAHAAVAQVAVAAARVGFRSAYFAVISAPSSRPVGMRLEGRSTIA